MSIKTLRPVTAFAFLVLATITTAGQDLCAEMRKWKAPQVIFSKFEGEDLLVVTKDGKLAKGAKVKQSAESGSYYFVANKQETELIVFTGKDYNLKITAPEYRHRQLNARWVNPKLLFIEIWFNPHYGAYWIFDVERERVVLSELQNDGLDAWRQCREGERIQKR